MEPFVPRKRPIDTLAATPIIIDWSAERPAAAAARYRANRDALVSRQPVLAATLSTDPPAPDPFILSRDGGASAAGDLPDLTAVAHGGGIMVVGVPSPSLLGHMLTLAGPHGYVPAVEIFEPDPVVFATWLQLVDPALIGSERLSAFVGDAAETNYITFRVARIARRDPTHVIRCARPGWAPPRDDDDPVRLARAAVAGRRRELLAKQAIFYDGRTPESWAARFRRFRDEGEALRVLGLTTRYSTVVQHSMRDLAAAFRRRGCDFDVIAEPDRSSNDVDAWSALARRPYDLVVLINAVRGQFTDRLHARVPCAAWIQDHVASLATPEAGRTIGSFDRVLCPRPWTLAARFEYPSERLVATGNTVSEDPFEGLAPTADELASFQCDVSYVSHASASVSRLVADLAAPKGAGFRAYLERIVESLKCHASAHRRGIPFDVKLEIALEAEGASPGVRLEPRQRAAAVVPLIDTLADRLFRHEALEWTAAWAVSRGRVFRLYGAGWEDHPTLGPFACGVIENGRPLACLARASAVNLQINGYGSLHPRLLDAVVADGFVLSRTNNADFIRGPMIALKEYVADHRVDDLPGLLACAKRDPDLDALLARFPKLGLFAIAPSTDPGRRREDRLLREVFDFPAELLTDEARFEAIRTAAPAPHRVAGDLPGFADLTFDDAASLHAHLDRFVDDRAARERAMRSMRQSVLEQDTAEVLVDRIVGSFCEAS